MGESSFVAAPLEGVECFRAANMVHHFPRHAHEFYSIGVIEDGVGGNYCRGATHEIPAGAIVVINPDEVHTGYAAGGRPLTYRMLHVYPNVFLGMTPSLPWFARPAIADLRWARALAGLHRQLEAAADPLSAEENLIETLTDFLAAHASEAAQPPAAGREPRAVQAVREYLESHYTQRVRLADLVRLTGLDRAYLIRSFRRSAGIPPHEYLTQVRIRHATHKLARGEGIAAVAIETGFADQSHLSRHFKRITGTTPGQYLAGHFRSRRS